METMGLMGDSNISVAKSPYRITYETDIMKEWIQRDGLDEVIKAIQNSVSNTVKEINLT